jgi:hypothetical protein
MHCLANVDTINKMPDLKDKVVVVRLSVRDKKLFREAAEKQDMKLADWMRRRLREVALKELRRRDR